MFSRGISKSQIDLETRKKASNSEERASVARQINASIRKSTQICPYKLPRAIVHIYHVVTWRIFPRYYRGMKSGFIKWNPLYLAVRRRILHLSVRVTRNFRIICLFFFLFIFFSMRAKIIRRAKSATTYFSANCLPSAFSVRRLIVGRLVLASTQHATSAEDHRLQLGPSAEPTYLFGCLSELIYLSNSAFI